ncbi:hypothetical protein Pan97_16210 [Bremerella volcania]|uniref:Uncharacterized protein n=1 Tax=Bremerella volcania TaxID=2527984 RepID=A0A518C5V7_9BACT|nr:hypothetical protein Pan97_16020 [Bremerella volcania]QDU74610.1 hypothetical protein Pan97_16210 [Bremerella volcania]
MSPAFPLPADAQARRVMLSKLSAGRSRSPRHGINDNRRQLPLTEANGIAGGDDCGTASDDYQRDALPTAAALAEAELLLAEIRQTKEDVA